MKRNWGLNRQLPAPLKSSEAGGNDGSRQQSALRCVKRYVEQAVLCTPDRLHIINLALGTTVCLVAHVRFAVEVGQAVAAVIAHTVPEPVVSAEVAVAVRNLERVVVHACVLTSSAESLSSHDHTWWCDDCDDGQKDRRTDDKQA